jgi:DNA modification methylase
MRSSTSSNRGDIVIDPFPGSGSTLMAADKIGQVSRGVDLDSLYVEVIMRQIRGRNRQPGGSYRDRRSVRRTGASRSREAAPV